MADTPGREVSSEVDSYASPDVSIAMADSMHFGSRWRCEALPRISAACWTAEA